MIWYGDHSVVAIDLSVVVSDKSYPQGVIYVMPLVYSNHPQWSHDLLTWSTYLSCICLAGIKPGWASVSIWSTRRAWGAKTTSHDTQWDHMMQYNKYLPPIRVIMINDLQDVSPTKGQPQVSTWYIAILHWVVVKVCSNIHWLWV